MNYQLGIFILRLSHFVLCEFEESTKSKIYARLSDTHPLCLHQRSVLCKYSCHCLRFLHANPSLIRFYTLQMFGWTKDKRVSFKSILRYRLKFTFHLLLFIAAIFCSLFVNVNSDTRPFISAYSVANRKQYGVKIPMLSHQSVVAKDNYVRYRNKN